MARMRTKQFEEFLDSIEYEEIVELRTKPDMNLMRAFRCDPVDWKEFIDAFLAANYDDEGEELEESEEEEEEEEEETEEADDDDEEEDDDEEADDDDEEEDDDEEK